MWDHRVCRCLLHESRHEPFCKEKTYRRPRWKGQGRGSTERWKRSCCQITTKKEITPHWPAYCWEAIISKFFWLKAWISDSLLYLLLFHILLKKSGWKLDTVEYFIPTNSETAELGNCVIISVAHYWFADKLRDGFIGGLGDNIQFVKYRL